MASNWPKTRRALLKSILPVHRAVRIVRRGSYEARLSELSERGEFSGVHVNALERLLSMHPRQLSVENFEAWLGGQDFHLSQESVEEARQVIGPRDFDRIKRHILPVLQIHSLLWPLIVTGLVKLKRIPGKHDSSDKAMIYSFQVGLRPSNPNLFRYCLTRFKESLQKSK